MYRSQLALKNSNELKRFDLMTAERTKTSLYERVVDVTADYLGPAAERFIDRQITSHLKKEPEQLKAKDLVKLIDWIKLSFALLTDNKRMVDEYINRLLNLANNSKSTS